ncbi:MAG: DNA translocase FtsK, partial [Candidatus Coproplasma sp.]
MKKKNNDGKQSYILTRETLGMTILLFCALLLIALLTRSVVFSSLGAAICTFMYGTFGYGCFLVVAALAYLGFWLVFEKKIDIKPIVVCIAGTTVFMLFLLFHSVSTRGFNLENFGSYLSQCFYSAEKGLSGYTFGGVISALIVYPIAKGTTFIGAYVIFSILTVLCGYLTYLTVRSNLMTKSAVAAAKAKASEHARTDAPEQFVPEAAQDRLYTVNENYEIVNNRAVLPHSDESAADADDSALKEEEDRFSNKNLGRKILFENGEFSAESYRRNMIFNEDSYFNHPVYDESNYLSGFSSGKSSPKPAENVQRSYSESYAEQIEQREEEISTPSYVYGERPAESLEEFGEDTYGGSVTDRTTEADYSRTIREDSYDEKFSDYSSATYGQTDVEETKSEELNVDEADWNGGDFAEDTLPDEILQDENLTDEIQTEEESEYGEAIRQSAEDEVETPPTRAYDNSFRSIFSASNSNISEDVIPDSSRLTRRREETKSNLFDDEEETGQIPDLGARGLRADRDATDENVISDRSRSSSALTGGVERPLATPNTQVNKENSNVVNQEVKEEKPVEPEKPKHVWKKYVRPTLDLLNDYPENNNTNVGEIEESKKIIIDTLESFRIASHILDVVVGPAITRYDVVIEDKTNIKNALKYRESIAMALMKENVTAYLNYSKGAISIEVPNSKRAVVGLKSMLASSQFINSKPNSLTFALGKDVEGKANCPDITKMPHLLVAGTTGSGKSICLSALIVSLLYKYGPDELRFILVDPKQAEFISYENLPHLMINEIIYDVDKAIKALNWAIKEMERRYALFKQMTLSGTLVKNINEYNSNLPEGEEKLPKIVIILDEFGDLMLQAKKDIESRIIRLVQKSRACGIHLILATQRPSVDCITGLIKSN